jgi:hypothetical protein
VKAGKDEMSQDSEMDGPADRVWLRYGDFLQRPKNEDSRRRRTLTQRTDRAKEDKRPTEQSVCFFYIVFVVVFPDSPTKQRVCRAGPEGLSCDWGCLGGCACTSRPLCCHRVAQAWFGPRARTLGSRWVGP